MKKMNKTKVGNPLSAMLKLTVFSLLINIGVIAVYATLITACDLSDGFVNVVSLLTLSLCCLILGFGTARTAGKNGLLWGMSSGAFLCAIMFLISYFCTENPSFASHQITRLISCLASGGIGGIIGRH